MREFQSNSERPEAKQFQFKLDKEPFTVELRSDGDAVLEWSELAASASESSGEDLESAAGVAFTARFFRLMMPAAEYARFRAHMRKHGTDQDILVEIMQAINEEMEELLEDSAERPTQPSSPLSAGRTAKADRMLTIASIPDGDLTLIGPGQETLALDEDEDEDGTVVLGKWVPGVPLAEQVPDRTARRQQDRKQQKTRRKAG